MEQKPVWIRAAVMLATIAGLIHLMVVPEHMEEWAGYGVFFLVVGVGQLLYAALLLRPGLDTTWLVAGIIGHLLIVVLYLVTRTIGIPFLGPQAGEVEAFGPIDLLSKLVELALIACLAAVVRARASSGHTARNGVQS